MVYDSEGTITLGTRTIELKELIALIKWQLQRYAGAVRLICQREKLDYEDIVSECIHCCMSASSEGSDKYSLAGNVCRLVLWHLARKLDRYRRRDDLLCRKGFYESTGSYTEHGYDQIDAAELAEQFALDCFKYCDERSAGVLLDYLGLYGSRDTLVAQAARLGVSKQRVSQLCKKAVSRLSTKYSDLTNQLLTDPHNEQPHEKAQE